MNWSDVSIDMYIKLYQVEQEELEEIDLLCKRIGILYGLSDEEVENMPITKYNQLQGELAFLLQEPNQTNLKHEIELNGVKFYLHNPTELSLGEWVDLESLQNEDVMNHIHQVMAMLYKKSKDGKYNPALAADNAELFLHRMDIETALSAFFFFYLYVTDYIMSNTADCSVLDKIIQGLKQMKMEMIYQDVKQLVAQERK